MAHGGHGGGGKGGSGIEGLTPPIGMLTALATLTGFLGAVWFFAKNPKSIVPALIMAALLAGLLGNGSVDASPLVGLLAFGGGAYLAATHSKKK